MTKHLQKDMVSLRKNILLLGHLVQEATDQAVQAISKLDMRMVDEVIAGEVDINQMEVDIEEECLKVLALHQPVATDLRFIIVVLKVNNDLERIGDQAVNIADRVRHLIDGKPLTSHLDFAAMGEIAKEMVRESLQALVDQNVDLARKVVEMDDELDGIHARNYTEIKKAMQADSEMVPTGVSYLTISSNLERIGDLSTNVAEEVIFMEEGEVVRHSSER